MKNKETKLVCVKLQYLKYYSFFTNIFYVKYNLFIDNTLWISYDYVQHIFKRSFVPKNYKWLKWEILIYKNIFFCFLNIFISFRLMKALVRSVGKNTAGKQVAHY